MSLLSGNLGEFTKILGQLCSHWSVLNKTWFRGNPSREFLVVRVQHWKLPRHDNINCSLQVAVPCPFDRWKSIGQWQISWVRQRCLILPDLASLCRWSYGAYAGAYQWIILGCQSNGGRWRILRLSYPNHWIPKHLGYPTCVIVADLLRGEFTRFVFDAIEFCWHLFPQIYWPCFSCWKPPTACRKSSPPTQKIEISSTLWYWGSDSGRQGWYIFPLYKWGA